MAGPSDKNTSKPRRWTVTNVLQILYENIALEGRNGIQVRHLFETYEPSGDILIQEACWKVLRQGIMQTNPVFVAHDPLYVVPANKDKVNDKLKSKKRKASNTQSKKVKKMKNDDEVECDIDVDVKLVVPPPKKDSKKKTSTGSVALLPQNELQTCDGQDISYKDAMDDITLVLVATLNLRLHALGCTKGGTQLNSNLHSVLELIGQTREKGAIITSISEQLFDGDIKRMHYFLDDLVAMQLVEKRILMLPPRRFNILHLSRFAQKFDPQTMGYSGFHYESDTKAILALQLHKSMLLRKEETAVFPDICKRFNLTKRQQESLRHYICHETAKNPNMYPLEMFMATCRGGDRSLGRKLWCVRVVDVSSHSNPNQGQFQSFPLQMEMGATEFLYRIMESRSEGVSIPDIRELCGNPDNRWMYKKIQHILVNHPIVTKKVLGSRGVVHKFTVQKTNQKNESTDTKKISLETLPTESKKVPDTPNTPIRKHYSLRNSIEQSGRELIGDVTSSRAAYLRELVEQHSIISLGLLRRLLAAHENRQARFEIDGRTIVRLLQTLVEQNIMEFIDVKIPMRQVSRHSRVHCVALPFVMKEESQETLRKFMEQYSHLEEVDSTARGTDSPFLILREDEVQREKSYHNKKETKKIVSYSHNILEYHKLQQKLRDHHRQCRRLGQAYGVLCRARLFHTALCRSLDRRNKWPDDDLTRIGFKLDEILGTISVKDYCKLLGTPELIHDEDEVRVKEMIVANEILDNETQWETLGDLGRLLQDNQKQRIRRLLEILIDFKLVEEEDRGHKDSTSEIPKVPNQSAEDSMLYVTRHTFITMTEEHASTPLRLGGDIKPVELNEIGKISLEYNFNKIEDVELYWRNMESFYLNHIRWEFIPATPEPGLPPMYVKPYSYPSVNATLDLLWTDSGSIQRHNGIEIRRRAKPTKKKFSSNLLNPKPKWKTDKNPKEIKTQCPLRLKRRRQRSPNFELTSKQMDEALLAYYNALKGNWQVEIPIELRFPNEPTRVFRNRRIKRGHVNWNGIGNEIAFPVDPIGKTRPYVGMDLKRMMHRNILPQPKVKHHIVQLETELINEMNPTGIFLEEGMIQTNPTLYGCLSKAVQMMLQPDEEFIASVGDDMLSQFSTLDIQIVWRYLYLSGMVNRGKVSDAGHRRGFSFSLSMFNFFRLNANQWPITMCCEAADHLGVLSTLQEEMDMAIPTNASSGYMATTMASCVRGTSSFTIEFDRSPEQVLNNMSTQTNEKRIKVTGIVGHMHRFTNGDHYESFNNSWTISTKTTESEMTQADESFYEAFSVRKRKRDIPTTWQCYCTTNPCTSMLRCKAGADDAILAAVEKAEKGGLTFNEIRNIFSSTMPPSQIQSRLDHLVADEKLCDVHAFSKVQYIAKSFATSWFVYPYTVAETDPPTIHFNREEPTVVRPWLKMDGTMNEKCLVVLKRELTMYVMEHPGVDESCMQEYFKGFLGLQDIRFLCFQLIEDNVLYSRATKRRKLELFKSSTPPERPIEGEYYMDREEFTLRYFPSIDCYGHLGNVIQELL